MNVSPIVARLRQQVAAFRLVGGAAEYERARAALTALPAAFVFPASEQAGENGFMDLVVQQQVAASFAVLMAVRNLADAEGAAAVESLEPVRIAVRNALLGWTPDGATDPCEYDRGEFLAFDNGTLWWHDFYRTTYLIRSV